MKLWETRRHWERFARTDALWAVLTRPDKAGNRWDIDELFATGSAEVAADLARVRALHPELRTSRALDFGCGVGRLTQALAESFTHVTGVDLSTGMLDLARRHNRHGDRVALIHNTRPDLSRFEDGSFDLVYSLITLQHIPPDYALRYIAEFVRVLASGGVVLFQLPARSSLARRKLSYYPPTVLKRAWRRIRRILAIDSYMAMHAVPRATVVATLQAAGATPLDVSPSEAAGDEFECYRYIALKP